MIDTLEAPIVDPRESEQHSSSDDRNNLHRSTLRLVAEQARKEFVPTDEEQAAGAEFDPAKARAWRIAENHVAELKHSLTNSKVPLDEFLAAYTSKLAETFFSETQAREQARIAELELENETQARQLANLRAALAEAQRGEQEARADEATKKAETATQLAFEDALTGLKNRRQFMGDLERLAPNSAVSLLAIDGDNMKIINDTFSHYSGDKYLQGIADTLRTVIRSGDTAYRLGGDEFMILLRDADPEEAETIARRIQEEIKDHLIDRISRRIDADKFEFKQRKAIAEQTGQPIPDEEIDTSILSADSLTASIGISSRPEGNFVSPMELTKQADTALYNAKYDRNSVRRHGEKAMYTVGMRMPTK